MNEKISISAAQDVEHRYKRKTRLVVAELEKKDGELNACKNQIKSNL